MPYICFIIHCLLRGTLIIIIININYCFCTATFWWKAQILAPADMKNCATMWRGVLYCKVKIMEYTNVQRDIREKHPLFPRTWAKSLGVRGPYRAALSLWLVFIYVKLNIVDWFCWNNASSTAQRRASGMGQMRFWTGPHDLCPNFHPNTWALTQYRVRHSKANFIAQSLLRSGKKYFCNKDRPNDHSVVMDKYKSQMVYLTWILH